MIEILTLKELKVLQKDEQEGAAEYDELSVKFAQRGHSDISQMFAQMADDERDHEANITMLIERKNMKEQLGKIIRF